MNNNQYTYNQPPMGPMMPPPQIGTARPIGWRERWMRRFGMDMSRASLKGELTIPHWLIGKNIIFFFVAMFACWGAYGFVPPMDL